MLALEIHCHLPDQRSAKDSALLMEKLAELFPSDDITIKVNQQYDVQDSKLEDEVHQTVKNKLDNNYLEKSDKTLEKTKLLKKIKDYFDKLSYEGIKTSVITVMKSLTEGFLD